MAKPGWRPAGARDLPRLREARLQAHYAAQWLARAARAFIPAQPDDSHTNLGWDAALGGFTTHGLPNGLRLVLALGDLSLVLVGDGGSQSTFDLNGRSDTEAGTWLRQTIAARGFDAGALQVRLPYALPAHALANGAAYRSDELRDALDELAAWFSNASQSLAQIRDSQTTRFAVSPVRCWPHHFDMATLIALDPGGGENARSVGVGLSLGDEHYEEPYFYVTPWPYPDAARLPRLPAPGQWHTHGFTAAVATASRIAAAKVPQAETEEFLRVAVEGSLKVLFARDKK